MKNSKKELHKALMTYVATSIDFDKKLTKIKSDQTVDRKGNIVIDKEARDMVHNCTISYNVKMRSIREYIINEFGLNEHAIEEILVMSQEKNFRDNKRYSNKMFDGKTPILLEDDSTLKKYMRRLIMEDIEFFDRTLYGKWKRVIMDEITRRGIKM